MENNTVLSAAGLSIGYPSKKGNAVIASGISLSLKAGELIALTGANGIGKSTLLRTLTGIQKPLGGEILLNGKNPQSYLPNELAQQLAIVLTESLPPSNLTVYEVVALGRQPYTNWLGTLSSQDREQVNRAMALTQTVHLADKKYYEISDGQLQKVLIARALAQDTPFIVLDEPTTHLDLLHKVSLLKLLRKLSAEAGKCILYSTHDLDLALQLSTQMIVMTPGAVVQDTPEKLTGTKVFDTLFDDEDIVFDKEKKSFRIR